MSSDMSTGGETSGVVSGVMSVDVGTSEDMSVGTAGVLGSAHAATAPRQIRLTHTAQDRKFMISQVFRVPRLP